MLIRGNKAEIAARPMTRHTSIVTFMELMMILWSSYLLLMFCYDDVFLGDHHPVTPLVGLGCLVGSFLIFAKQLHIAAWGANIRMAIAGVVVFWTPAIPALKARDKRSPWRGFFLMTPYSLYFIQHK